MSGHVVRIADPAKSLERCVARQVEAERIADRLDAAGHVLAAKTYRRRASALKAAATRIGKLI